MLYLAKNEQTFLHFLFDNPDFVFKLEDNYFVSGVAKSFFNAIQNLQSEGISIQKDSILTEGNKLNSSINQDTVEKIYNTEYENGKFDYYYSQLKKNYAKYNIENKLLKDILTKVTSKGDLDINQIKQLNRDLEEQIEIVEGRNALLLSPDYLIDKYQTIMYKRSSGDFQFSFGDSFLDKHVYGGAQPGSITTLFGSTGSGKSAYILNLVNKCINKKIPCIYDSLEMNDMATMDRLIAIRNKIPMNHLCPKNDEIDEHIFKIIETERKKLKEIDTFYMIESPNQCLDDIKRITKEAKKRFKSEYIIFFADLYTMFRDSGSSPQEIEDGVNRLHAIVKELNIHFVAVVQANRQLEGQKPKDLDDLDRYRPTLASIKNSGAFAERSRLVLSLFRPKAYANRFFEYCEDEELLEQLEMMPDICNIQILKQNQGMTSTLKYAFDAECFRFIPDYREVVE